MCFSEPFTKSLTFYGAKCRSLGGELLLNCGLGDPGNCVSF
jgi:hypothetical protein